MKSYQQRIKEVNENWYKQLIKEEYHESLLDFLGEPLRPIIDSMHSGDITTSVYVKERDVEYVEINIIPYLSDLVKSKWEKSVTVRSYTISLHYTLRFKFKERSVCIHIFSNDSINEFCEIIPIKTGRKIIKTREYEEDEVELLVNCSPERNQE